MLEFFRRHRGAFLITLTVIIIVSFSVWGGWKKAGRGEGSLMTDTAFTIYGRDYTVPEMHRLQRRLRPMFMMGLMELYQGLDSAARGPDTQGGDFLFNSLVLEHEMEKLGVNPSNEDAKEALQKLSPLQENGKFSLERAQMLEQNVAADGLSGQDLLDIMKLDIGLKAMQALLGKNYVPSPVEVEKAYASKYQTLKISTIDFKLDDFKKAAQVTDADIQKYYDEKKDSYKTAEKRGVSYIFFAEPKPEEKKPEEKKPEDDKKTPEKKAEEKAAEEKKKAEEEAKAAEKLKQDRNAMVERINKLNAELRMKKAAFAETAASLKETVVKAPAFARDAAPAELKDEADVMEAIFSFNKDTHGFSEPVRGSKGFYIFTVDQIEEPKQQELAAVKDKIKETLVEQKGQEALGKAVNEARTALQEGLKAGKKIEDLAKEKKLTLSPQTELTISEPPATLANAQQIADSAKDTPAGEVTRVMDTPAGATLAYVYSKELRKRDNSADLRKSMENSIARKEREHIFNSWFAQKREEAKLKFTPRGSKTQDEE